MCTSGRQTAGCMCVRVRARADVKFARIRAVPCGAAAADVLAAAPQMHVSSPLELLHDWDMLQGGLVSAFQLLLYLGGVVLGARLRFAGTHAQGAAGLKPNYLVMCVLISSFPKAFYTLMMIW
eukprot:COSAG01_NODE_10735_length_2092_cov_4.321626_2_plen_123_part_00